MLNRGLAGEEIALVHAVDRPVVGHLRANDLRQRREEVVDGHHLVARARRDLPRPLNHVWHAQRPLQRIA
jgi:hypothetical protein